MRTVEYERHEFHGEPEKVAAPIWAFVFDVPYLAICDVFPPLHVLNQLLESGGSEGGMSCGTTWQPFAISEAEYEELLALVLRPNREELEKYARYHTQQMCIDPEFDHIGKHLDWIMAVGEKHRDAYRKRVGG